MGPKVNDTLSNFQFILLTLADVLFYIAFVSFHTDGRSHVVRPFSFWANTSLICAHPHPIFLTYSSNSVTSRKWSSPGGMKVTRNGRSRQRGNDFDLEGNSAPRCVTMFSLAFRRSKNMFITDEDLKHPRAQEGVVYSAWLLLLLTIHSDFLPRPSGPTRPSHFLHAGRSKVISEVFKPYVSSRSVVQNCPFDRTRRNSGGPGRRHGERRQSRLTIKISVWCVQTYFSSLKSLTRV